MGEGFAVLAYIQKLVTKHGDERHLRNELQ